MLGRSQCSSSSVVLVKTVQVAFKFGRLASIRTVGYKIMIERTSHKCVAYAKETTCRWFSYSCSGVGGFRKGDRAEASHKQSSNNVGKQWVSPLASPVADILSDDLVSESTS